MTRRSDDGPHAGTNPAATAAYAQVLAALFPNAADEGVVPASPPPPPDPPRIPGYTILERLGRGGTGEVYGAWDERVSRMVALKFLRAGTERGAVCLENEAHLLFRCTHPNIVRVYHVGTYTDTRVFLAMEYITGTTLAAWLDAEPREPRAVLRLMAEVGRALEAAHDVGVIHCDIQPSNILVDERGHARLIDFGLAHVETAANSSGPLVGTPNYIAPEHLAGAACTSRSDQYSFCAVLLEGLYTKPPAALLAGDRQHLPRRPGLRRHARAALLRGIHPEPAARWPSMDALLHELTRPWWRDRTLGIVLFGCLLITLLGAEVLTLQLWSYNQAAVDACEDAIAQRSEQIRRQAETLGITSDVDLLARDARQHCEETATATPPAPSSDLIQCLDATSAALDAIASHRDDDADQPDGTRIRHAWSQFRVPRPPLARCAPQVVRPLSVAGSEALVDLVELRLLVHHQQFARARRLLDNTDLLGRLRRHDAHAALAEALLHASQVVRRHAQQDTTIVIDGHDATALLDLAETAAEQGEDDFLGQYIALERVHLALDLGDTAVAERRLARIRLRAAEHDELAVRRHIVEARLADDPQSALSHLHQAAELVSRSDRLSSTALPVELLALRALRTDGHDRRLAHTYYKEAVMTAVRTLGSHDYLTGTIAANASRHAFEIHEVDAGEAWGIIGLSAFDTAFGTRTLPLEQLSYDLAYNLYLAGEADRGLEYADRALGHARRIRSDQEVAFSLELRGMLELRAHHYEAAQRSLTEALAAYPASLGQDTPYRYSLELLVLITTAALAPNATVDASLKALAARLDATNPDVEELQRDIRVLRIEVLARTARHKQALTLVRWFDDARTNAIDDPITRADIHLARAYVAERSKADDVAQRETCAAVRIYNATRTDGARRLREVSSESTRPPLSPSIDLYLRCHSPP